MVNYVVLFMGYGKLYKSVHTSAEIQGTAVFQTKESSPSHRHSGQMQRGFRRGRPGGQRRRERDEDRQRSGWRPAPLGATEVHTAVMTSVAPHSRAIQGAFWTCFHQTCSPRRTVSWTCAGTLQFTPRGPSGCPRSTHPSLLTSVLCFTEHRFCFHSLSDHWQVCLSHL